MIEAVQKFVPWANTLALFPKILLSAVLILFAFFILAIIWIPQKETSIGTGPTNTQPPTPKAGNVVVSGNVSAGDGSTTAPGGSARIEGGTGYNGASGGNVNVGPGTYKAGDAGPGGTGGDLIIKGGDAK